MQQNKEEMENIFIIFILRNQGNFLLFIFKIIYINTFDYKDNINYSYMITYNIRFI